MEPKIYQRGLQKGIKSLVHSQVEYAASAWSPWLARDKAQVERVQCRAARYVYHTYSSVTAMLQSLDWETLESHRFNMCLCIIYKVYYNLVMFPLLDYATPVTVQTWGRARGGKFDTLSIFFKIFDHLIVLFNWELKQKDAFVFTILFSFNLALFPVINIELF